MELRSADDLKGSRSNGVGFEATQIDREGFDFEVGAVHDDADISKYIEGVRELVSRLRLPDSAKSAIAEVTQLMPTDLINIIADYAVHVLLFGQMQRAPHCVVFDLAVGGWVSSSGSLPVTWPSGRFCTVFHATRMSCMFAHSRASATFYRWSFVNRRWTPVRADSSENTCYFLLPALHDRTNESVLRLDRNEGWEGPWAEYSAAILPLREENGAISISAEDQKDYAHAVAVASPPQTQCWDPIIWSEICVDDRVPPVRVLLVGERSPVGATEVLLTETTLRHLDQNIKVAPWSAPRTIYTNRDRALRIIRCSRIGRLMIVILERFTIAFDLDTNTVLKSVAHIPTASEYIAVRDAIVGLAGTKGGYLWTNVESGWPATTESTIFQPTVLPIPNVAQDYRLNFGACLSLLL